MRSFDISSIKVNSIPKGEEPAVSIKRGSIRFNAQAVKCLGECQFVHMMINVENKKIIIKPSNEEDPNRLYWVGINKHGKITPRMMSCKPFTTKLYNDMEWDTNKIFNLMGTMLVHGDEKLLVFDLSEVPKKVNPLAKHLSLSFFNSLKQNPITNFSNMRKIISSFLNLLVIMATALITTNVISATLPKLPNPSSWMDNEEKWEFDFTPFNGRQSEFYIKFTLDASPTNSLEIGIWENKLGVVDEPEAVLGWDCGELFIKTNGVHAFSDYIVESERLAISFAVRLSGKGEPILTSIIANGTPLEFYDDENEPVIFKFNPAWDTARVISRGIGEVNERVSFGFSSDPTVISVR